MGGFYELLIGLVKRSLRKAIGKLCLTYDQLLTILKEVEAVVNSRPLVYIEDDINSSMTLTPSHFLTLNPTEGIPTYDADDNDHDFSPNEFHRQVSAEMEKGVETCTTILEGLERRIFNESTGENTNTTTRS